MSIHLGQVLLTAVVTAVVSLLVMESYQTTPWLADKMMRWSVRLRYTDNTERATVRGEELISFLEDLPTLLKLPTASGFLFRALAYRLAHRRSHARREPRTDQRSLGARFRTTLAKAGLVFACTSTVFGIELFAIFVIFSADTGGSLGACSVCGIVSGISAASAVVARSLGLRPGLIGGIMCELSIFVSIFAWWFVTDTVPLTFMPEVLFGGAGFGLTAALTGVLAGKCKHVAGVFLGVLVHFSGAMLIILSHLLPMYWRWFDFGYIGLGFMAGALAGFAVVIERGVWRKTSGDRSPALPGIP